MSSGTNYSCNKCSKIYATKQNLKRHLSDKHSLCSLENLEVRCAKCKEKFKTLELFKFHLLSNMDGLVNGNPSSVVSLGTPVQDEQVAGASTHITLPWTPLQNSEARVAQVYSNGILEAQRQPKYQDLEDFVRQQTYSPVSDCGDLPEPDTFLRKRKMCDTMASASAQPENLTEKINSLETHIDAKLARIEEKLDRIPLLFTEALQENVTKNQMYSRSLTAALQKDLKATKDLIQSLAASASPPASATKIPPELVKSVVELNSALMDFIHSDK